MLRNDVPSHGSARPAPGLKIHLAVIKDPRSLKAWKGNPRKHSKRDINKLMKAIGKRGFYNPILIDEHNTVLAGHGRLAAALELGMQEVPCIVLSGLSEVEKRAVLIVDNRLGEESTWDDVNRPGVAGGRFV